MKTLWILALSGSALLAGLPVRQAPTSDEIGRVPLVVVEMFDQLAADGALELTIDRDGTIREIEAEIPISELPRRIRDAVLEHVPDATVVGAEREVQGAERVFEVQLEVAERGLQLVVSADGKILESEVELTRAQVPIAVLDAADRALPGGEFVSVEMVEHLLDGHREFHVKKAKDGASYKVVLDPAGKVTRKVREAVAEIEIPLPF